MADIKQYIAGKEVNRRNFEDLVIVLDWLNGRAQPSINVENVTLVNDQGTELRERILNGLNGGVGVFEGEPSRFEISENGNSINFNGYLDFTNNLEFIGRSEVSASFKLEQGVDWLNDTAAGFSYRYLYDIGVITDSDFVDIPYVLNYIPDGTQLVILAISIYSLTRELIENIKSISEGIKDLTNAVTPVVGVSAGLGAGVVTAYDIGDIIAAALSLAIKIAFAIALVYAIIELLTQVRGQLMPLKRYHRGIPVKTLFSKACEFLNLKLESSLLDNLDVGGQRWVYMPTKSKIGSLKTNDRTTENGLPLANSIMDTFEGVIQTYSNAFNADFIIKDGVFKFERIDKLNNSSTYTIPNTFTDQNKLQDITGLNTNEVISNYVINWAYDSLDLNTLDNQEGRIFQGQLQAKKVNNPNLRNLKGFKQVSIPMAQAVRKNKLTVIEEVVKFVTQIGDSLTGQLGKATSLTSKINNRIGVMHLSNHITSTDKIVIMAGSKLAKNQRDITNAGKLWDEYHYINSFAPNKDGEHSQYYLYEAKEIPFSVQNLLSLIDGGSVETQYGERAKIEVLEYSPRKNKASIKYRVNRLYDNNLELVKL